MKRNINNLFRIKFKNSFSKYLPNFSSYNIEIKITLFERINHFDVINFFNLALTYIKLINILFHLILF